MKLCESSNHTYVALDYNVNYILTVKDNQILGPLGRCIDKLLCKKIYRKCQIIGEEYLGKRLENGTYSGILGLLQSDKADLYLKGEPYYINEPWLKTSNPIRTEGLYIGHRIFESKNVEYFDVFKNLDIGLEMIIFFSVFLLTAFSLSLILIKLINYIQSKKLTFKYLIYRYFFNRKVSTISYFLLFLSLFFWHIQMFISNEFQTNRIVVNLDEIIKNEHDILHTKKVACIVKQEIDVHKASNYSRNSIFSRILDKKMTFPKEMKIERTLFNNDKCVIAKGSPLIRTYNSNIFFVGSLIFELSVYFLYSAINLEFKGWKLSQPILDFNEVIFYSMRNKDNEKFMTKIIAQLTENGLFKQLYICMEDNTHFAISKSVKIFKTIEEFTNEKLSDSEISDLSINNFLSLFITYFLFCLILFFIWTITYIVRTKKYKFFKISKISLRCCNTS